MQKSQTTNKPRAHSWGPPVAGAGSSEVCRSCGAKRVVVGDDLPCAGRDAGSVAETTNDYDPFE